MTAYRQLSFLNASWFTKGMNTEKITAMSFQISKQSMFAKSTFKHLCSVSSLELSKTYNKTMLTLNAEVVRGLSIMTSSCPLGYLVVKCQNIGHLVREYKIQQ